MRRAATSTERTPEQLRQHYEVERELADRLRRAPPDARRRLYGTVYDELFARVPHHPRLRRRRDPETVRRRVERQLRALEPLLRHDATFLEIGPGDCGLSFAVARRVRRVVAADVSTETVPDGDRPDNFRLVLVDGVRLPLRTGSVDLAYSNQLLEHLHPEDALDQLREVRRVLADGGAYLCVTPHRFLGPHDISKFFDAVPTGLHLKEYTVGELARTFRRAGFSRLSLWVSRHGRWRRASAVAFRPVEVAVGLLPRTLGRRVAGSPRLKRFFSGAVLAECPRRGRP